MDKERDVYADYLRVMNKAHVVGDHVIMTGKGDHLGNVSIRCSDGKTRRGHRIVWEQHNGKIPIGWHLTRKCQVQGCIRKEHLELITPHEREERKKVQFAALSKAERQVREEQRIRVRHDGLGPDEVKAIYFDPRSQRQIAHAYGVCASTVHKIKHGLVWAHTTGHVKEGENQPKHDARLKLTDKQVYEILQDKRPTRQIAADYGVSHVTVYRIQNYLERQNVKYWED